jgi:hypothetical protein
MKGGATYRFTSETVPDRGVRSNRYVPRRACRSRIVSRRRWVVGAIAGLPHQLLGFGAVPGNVGAIARQCPQLIALSSGHVLTSRRRCRREGQHRTPLRVLFDDLLNVRDAAGLPVERAGMVTCQFMHGA